MKRILRFFAFFAPILGVVVLGVSLLFQHDKPEVDYEDEIEDRKWLQLKRQGSQHGKRFIVGKRFVIGAVTFLMATAAFMGVEYAAVVGAALIVLAFCVNILTKPKIL